MTDLRELEKRLEEATGPDRELDFELHWHTLAPDDQKVFDGVRHVPSGIFIVGHGRTYIPLERCAPERFVSSLDAAVALVERVLPGWGYFIRKDEEGVNASLLYATALRVSPGGGQHQSSPALALCLALIRALIAKGDRHD